jgi:hypothetical protein
VEAKLIKHINISKRGKWTNSQLEDAMDVVERRHTYLKKVAKYWNIPLSSLLDHMNGRIRCRKLGP